MKLIGFIKDENGNYYSVDRRVRYKMLENDDFLAYRKSEEGQQKQFHMMEDADKIMFFDTTPELIQKYESEDNHTKYLFRCQVESGIQEVSCNDTVVTENETKVELIESIADESANTEKQAIRNCNIFRLYFALSRLRADEYELVYWLYLAPKRISLKKYAELKRVPRTTMQDQKSMILEKIKSFL